MIRKVRLRQWVKWRRVRKGGWFIDLGPANKPMFTDFDATSKTHPIKEYLKVMEERPQGKKLTREDVGEIQRLFEQS